MPNSHLPSFAYGVSGNLILDSLSVSDAEALAPHMRPVELRRGQVVIAQNGKVLTVQFPATAVLANAVVLSDGSSIETAAVGREGCSGLAAFMAEEPIFWEVTVKLPGLAWEISAERLRAEVERSPTLLLLLLKATHDAQSQAAQNAACIAVHPTTQRLAKWLLELMDRTANGTVALTQQEMAATLGAERTTVNAALGMMRRLGIVAQDRGRVRVLDRKLLEDASCECYFAQQHKSR